MFFPEKSSARDISAREKQKAAPAEIQNAFLKDYLETAEQALTEEERRRVDAFLEKILFTKDGEEREYNDIAGDIFSLERDPAMAALQTKLEKQGQPKLRDYLMTKADVLLDRYPKDNAPSHSGVFRIPAPEAGGLEGERAQQEEAEKRERLARVEHRPVSKMNLERLLSKEVIGTLDPPTICQCNDGFGFPEPDGIRFLKPAAAVAEEKRSLARLSESELYGDDLVIELPASRIRDRILPVPANYTVMGSLDQALELADPNEENPFCTRMLNDIEGDHVRYAVSRRSVPFRIDPKKFSPDADEREELKHALPFPEKDLPRGRASVYGAKLAIAEHMRDQFLYLCDDRIGQFIEDRPKELGPILDGLRAGHCDLLAWAAAAYFRQLGHTAFIVNTECSANSGQGFLRDVGHSRVGVVKENGLIMHVDPTEICRAVKGYGLKHVSDEEISELEKHFDAADGPAEKKNILETFRAAIMEKETLIHEEPVRAGASLRLIDDAESVFNDIHVTNKDVEAYLKSAINFFSPPLGDEQKKEMNKLCEILAAHRLPLMFEAVSQLDLAEKLAPFGARAREVMEREQDQHTKFSDFFINLPGIEKRARTLFPDYIEAQYAAIAEQDYGHLRGSMLFAKGITDLAVSFFPEKGQLMHYREAFVPSDLIDGQEYPADQFVEQMMFLKLVAAALADQEAAAFLKTRFGVDEERLKAFAVQFEPKLSPGAKIKQVASSLEAFSGKRTKAEYQELCRRAETIHDELTVNAEEYRMASGNFLRLLSGLKLRPERAKNRDLAEKDIFDRLETEYEPASHELRMIDPSASARHGKLMVKTERPVKPPLRSLSVHVDTDFIESNCFNMIAHFARMRVIIESLIKYSRLKKIPVSVSSSSNDYFLISPEAHPAADILCMRLLFGRIDRINKQEGENYGLRTKDGLPKNLLYLSGSQGKVNAVKFVLGKSVNLTVKNFSDVGLDIFPRLKIHSEKI